jgi:tRNA synthetases class I (R)
MEEGRFKNVLDAVSGVLERHGLDRGTRLSVPHHPGRRDLSLFGLPHGSAAADRALAELQELDLLGSVSRGKGDRTGIRLSDDGVSEVGELLESGAMEVMGTADLCASRRIAIDFCDPNATKALHVGHLRNLALGQAMASIFRTAGARVTTNSQVGDIGRSMAEAVAGYIEFADGEDPLLRGVKSDHFVGACYSRYVQEASDPGPVTGEAISDPALSREDLERDDLATEVMRRLRDGDRETVAHWRRLRDWALEGQAETLARLGVTIDNHFLESDYLVEIESCGDRLVEIGAAEVAATGVTFYATGDSNYPHLVLRRSDGHSTQHLRYMALWDATRPAINPGESLQVMGDEWLPLANYGDRLLAQLAGDEPAHPGGHLLHGMVTVEDRVVKSSVESAWLIDELLDELATRPQISEAARGDAELADRLAATAALGFFFAHPPAKSLQLSRDALLDPAVNAGWAMAAASLKAWEEQYDGPPDPAPKDRDYRFLVAQSQVHRQLSRRVCTELNPVHLARFHMHLCQWFLGTACTPRLARAMRTASSVGLASLGLPALVRSGPAATSASVEARA